MDNKVNVLDWTPQNPDFKKLKKYIKEFSVICEQR